MKIIKKEKNGNSANVVYASFDNIDEFVAYLERLIYETNANKLFIDAGGFSISFELETIIKKIKDGCCLMADKHYCRFDIGYAKDMCCGTEYKAIKLTPISRRDLDALLQEA